MTAGSTRRTTGTRKVHRSRCPPRVTLSIASPRWLSKDLSVMKTPWSTNTSSQCRYLFRLAGYGRLRLRLLHHHRRRCTRIPFPWQQHPPLTPSPRRPRRRTSKTKTSFLTVSTTSTPISSHSRQTVPVWGRPTRRPSVVPTSWTIEGTVAPSDASLYPQTVLTSSKTPPPPLTNTRTPTRRITNDNATTHGVIRFQNLARDRPPAYTAFLATQPLPAP